MSRRCSAPSPIAALSTAIYPESSERLCDESDEAELGGDEPRMLSRELLVEQLAL
jgi:hypothetical protein